MGRRLILIVLSGGLALGLLHWSERPGHTLPKWVLLLAALPLLLLSAANDDDGDDGDDDSALGRFLSGFGKFYFGVGGMALIVVGFVGLSLGAGGVSRARDRIAGRHHFAVHRGDASVARLALALAGRRTSAFDTAHAAAWISGVPSTAASECRMPSAYDVLWIGPISFRKAESSMITGSVIR